MTDLTLSRTFDTDDHSNLTVNCGHLEWKVHRALEHHVPVRHFQQTPAKIGPRYSSNLSYLPATLPLLTLLTLHRKVFPTSLIRRKTILPCDERSSLLATPAANDDTVSDVTLNFHTRMHAMADKYDVLFLRKLFKDMRQARSNGPMDMPRFLKPCGPSVPTHSARIVVFATYCTVGAIMIDSSQKNREISIPQGACV